MFPGDSVGCSLAFFFHATRWICCRYLLQGHQAPRGNRRHDVRAASQSWFGAEKASRGAKVQRGAVLRHQDLQMFGEFL